MTEYLRRLQPSKPVYRHFLEAEKKTSPSFWSGELVISEIIEESSNCKTFRLKPAQGNIPFAFVAGQYVDVSLEVEGETLNRSYSISSSSVEKSFIDLTIKREPKGLVSRALHDHAQIGQKLPIRGPLGVFCFSGEKVRPILLLGAGVGVTPLVSMIRSLHAQNWQGQIHAVFGYRNEEEALFVNELEALAEAWDKFDLTIVWSNPLQKVGKVEGRVTVKQVAKVVPKFKSCAVYICGPKAMMDDLTEGLQGKGVSKSQIHLEAFAPPPVDESLGGEYEINFRPSWVQAKSQPGENILKTALRSGVPIDYSCQSGTCGMCVAKLVSGEVEMLNTDALDDDDLAENKILTCQAYPQANCVVKVDRW